MIRRSARRDIVMATGESGERGRRCAVEATSKRIENASIAGGRAGRGTEKGRGGGGRGEKRGTITCTRRGGVRGRGRGIEGSTNAHRGLTVIGSNRRQL